jgi:chromosomal replication initiator protein
VINTSLAKFYLLSLRASMLARRVFVLARAVPAKPRHVTGSPAEISSLQNRLEQAIVQRINQDRYNLWFGRHTKLFVLDDEIRIGVPNLMCQEWLQKTFGEDVRAAARDVVGDGVAVRFVIDPELFREARAEQQRVADAPSKPNHEPQREQSVVTKPAKAKRRWRALTEFVVGPCNRVAYASAQSVVEEPGFGGNPLVLYGPVGTGKTHLLEGICRGVRKNWPDLAVRFTTAEQFTNAFVQAMHLGKQSGFRKQFRDAAVLLVDDLDFLAGKKATQIEFLHTFDALIADNRQIVVTTDCHPRLADDLMPELIDRLLGGAVWSLLPPDATTRLDLLRAKSAFGMPAIPEDVLAFLAQQLRGNVRELEGAIHSVRHFARVANRPVDQSLAREALGDLIRHAIRAVGVRDVDTAVCSALRLPTGALQSKQRTWAIARPRMIAIYLCRKHTAATYGEIGHYFGTKNHSTAVAAEKKVKGWIQTNASMKTGERDWRVGDLIEKIERDLGR